VSQVFVVGSITFSFEAAALPLQATTCSTVVPVNAWDETNFLSLWGVLNFKNFQTMERTL